MLHEYYICLCNMLQHRNLNEYTNNYEEVFLTFMHIVDICVYSKRTGGKGL